MIKIERKMTAKAQKAIESLRMAKSQNSTYNTPEVNAALEEIFYGKCYICENKDATSYQIEHLHPHRRDKELKYDWDNLFWACAHCNNTKLGKYEPIVDCTKENVEDMIAFRKSGYFGTEEKLVFEILDFKEETINTVKLLQDVYYGVSPQKEIEARKLRKALRKEISEFKEYVREYQEAEDEDKEDFRCLVEQKLKNNSPFAAFKRQLIRDNQDAWPEFTAYINQLNGDKNTL